jgi:hypothetical protein
LFSGDCLVPEKSFACRRRISDSFTATVAAGFFQQAGY